MDEFLIELQAKLDEAKSKGNVNADINKLQNELDKLKVQVELDPKSAQKLTDDIGKLINQKITISNIGIDTNKTIKTAQQTGQQIGNAISQGVTNAVSKAGNALKSFSDLRSFSELNKSINNFHVDTSELKNYKSILDEIKTTYAEFGQVRITNEIFKDGVLGKFKVNIEQVNGDLKETKSFMMSLNDEKDAFLFSGLISGSESVVQHLDKTKDAVNQTAEAINALKEKAQIDKIQLSMDNGHGASEYQNRINAVIASLEKYGVETQEAKNITASLQSTFDNMKGMSGQELVTQADKLEQEFKAVKVSVDQAKLSYDKLMQPASKEKISSTLLKVQKLLDNNTKVTENVKNEWKGYVNRLSSGSDIAVKEINDINIRLKQTESSMRSIGKLGLSWTDKLKQAWEKFGGWGFATGTMMTLYDQIRKIPKEVIKVNSSMIELDKVSDASDSDISKYFSEAADSAKRYGSAVSDMINATADWSRLGYNLPDSKKLAEIVTLYTNVGDGIDMNTANEHLISTLQGFQLDAEDAIGIIDRFNEVANNFPIDTAGIGEALQRSAASFYAANTDLSKSIALITGTNSVVQDPDSVGTMWKTVSMRLRGVTQELEAAGLETEGMVKSTAQLRDLIQGLTGFDIMTDEAGTQFKDVYDIVVGIGHEWKNLTDVEQAGLLEVLAGKRQGNALSAALNNISMIEEAYKTAENSAGSALEEQEKYEQGIEYSLKRLEAVFQTFANHILDSNVVKGIFDFGSSAIETIDKITSKLGSLGTIGLGTGLFAGVKNSGVRKCVLFICFLF